MWNGAFAKKNVVLWRVPPYFALLVSRVRTPFRKNSCHRSVISMPRVVFYGTRMGYGTDGMCRVDVMDSPTSWSVLDFTYVVKVTCLQRLFWRCSADLVAAWPAAGRQAVGPRIIRQMRCRRHRCVTPRGHRTESDCTAAQSHLSLTIYGIAVALPTVNLFVSILGWIGAIIDIGASLHQTV